MAGFNRIILIGQVVQNPEVRALMDGTAMAKFKLSVARSVGAGSDLFDIVVWRGVAEQAGEQVKQGETILVEGRIQIRSFEDQLGERNWATEIVASNFYPFPATKAPIAHAAKAESEFEETEELPADNLPF